jgi:hypothetical protein
MYVRTYAPRPVLTQIIEVMLLPKNEEWKERRKERLGGKEVSNFIYGILPTKKGIIKNIENRDSIIVLVKSVFSRQDRNN